MILKLVNISTIYKQYIIKLQVVLKMRKSKIILIIIQSYLNI